MIKEGARSKRHIAFCVVLLALLFARIALGCDQPSTLREADPEEIRAFFKAEAPELDAAPERLTTQAG